MSKPKSVAIVGAGPSGLVCAKVLLDDGFVVILFDRQQELGGLWTAETAYADLHTQQPGGTIEFSNLFDGEGKKCVSYMFLDNIISKLLCFDLRVCFLGKGS
jgi:cation diffusion facilitator CzcD-associated flavoprotein CzcO